MSGVRERSRATIEYMPVSLDGLVYRIRHAFFPFPSFPPAVASGSGPSSYGKPGKSRLNLTVLESIVAS